MGRLAKNFRPGGDDTGRNLGQIVERTERNITIFKMRRGRDRRGILGRLVTEKPMRQANQLFAVMGIGLMGIGKKRVGPGGIGDVIGESVLQGG